MKRILFFFLLISNIALAQTKITLTLPESGSGAGIDAVGSDFRLSNDSLYLYRWVNILDFGAVADGATNNVTAINNAIASGAKVIHIPPTTLPFLVTGTAGATPLLELQDYQSIVGSGYYSQLKTTSGARILRAGIGSEIAGIRFTGDNSKTTTEEFQAGIYGGSGDIKVNIHDCWFENLGGNSNANGGGVVFSNTAGGATEGNRITNNHFINNHYGITFASRGEYNIVLGNKFITGKIGIYNEAGNNTFISNTVQDCDTAYKLYNGTNNAHCVSSGNTYNHNIANLVVDGVTNGYVFNGDMFYAGNIIIRDATGIRFDGCDFSSGTITLTNNTSLYRSGRWLSMTKSVVSGEDFNVLGEEKTGTTAGYWINQANSDTVDFKGPPYLTLSNAVGTKAVRYNPSTRLLTYADTTTFNKPALTKNATIENPTASENMGWFRTPVAITVTNTHAVLVGSASPSVTYQISFGTDITSLTNVYTAGQTVTSTTTGTAASGVNDATIPANSWIRITTSAQSGTVGQISLSLTYTED